MYSGINQSNQSALKAPAYSSPLTATESVRPPEVAREVNYLGNATDELHSVIEELSRRLDAVCAPVPENDCAHQAVEGCGSALAGTVQTYRLNVQSASGRLRLLIASLAI